MSLFFTADTHFSHDKIRKLSNRPFQSIGEMDEALITNINDTVREYDTLYHLGDFSFYRDPEMFCAYRDRIRCKNFYLIPGNHDRSRMRGWRGAKIREKIQVLPPLVEIRHEGQPITLCHYPMVTWNKSHYGAWQLHGHCHGSLSDDSNALRMDVGVDPNGYVPVSIAEVESFMAAKTFVPVDHHVAPVV